MPRQLTLWPFQLYALSLGGPCPLKPGHAEVDGEMVWLNDEARYRRVMSGEDSWLRCGYRVEIRIEGQRAATAIPPGRRRRRRRKKPLQMTDL